MEPQIIRPQARELDHVHPEYATWTPEQKRNKAFAKLQQYIDAGAARAQEAVQRILGEVPNDSLVPVPSIKVAPLGTMFEVAAGEGDRRRRLGGLHQHALDQLAERLGLPTKYLHALHGSEWGRALIANNINELAQHAGGKLLMREVEGEVRGVLGASFRREDSRPAVDALIGVAREVGALVVDGSALDTKASIKVMLRQPVELFEGEYAVFGLDYRTSDYGDGAREIYGWILRLLCLNGATTVSGYRRVHIGARMDDVAFSEATRELNSRASASAAADIGRALLGQEAITTLVAKARAAHAKELSADAAIASIKTRVSKEEQKQIVEKYNSPDIELLPPGNTAWRFSNAISWLANQTEDKHRKLELELVAGTFVG